MNNNKSKSYLRLLNGVAWIPAPHIMGATAVAGLALTLGACTGDIATSSSSVVTAVSSSADNVVSSAQQVSSAAAAQLLIQENTAGFCGLAGVIESDRPGFTGEGYSNVDNAVGASVTWSLAVTQPTTVSLEWRYSNGNTTNRVAQVSVNGSVKAMGIPFASTGNWEAWGSETATIELAEGKNTLVLSATVAEGLGNIDSLSVEGNGVVTASCPQSASELLSAGKTLYQIQCASCHDDEVVSGLDGMGLYDIDLAAYGTDVALSQYIAQAMPKGTPATCDIDCATAVTAFMRNGYRDGTETVSSGGFTQPLPAQSTIRKVKNILTGMAPTNMEFSTNVSSKTEMEKLVSEWVNTPEFDEKMIFFFSNTFQQTGLDVSQFWYQLRNRPGALNLSYGMYGDSAFPMLFKNMNESFARTALHFAKTGRSFEELLYTDEIMMTTALKSLYMQIEANWDTESDSKVMRWKFNYGRRPRLEDTLNPNHADFMRFGYAKPGTITTSRTFNDDGCTGNTGKEGNFPGNVYLFHVLLGSTKRDTKNTGCWERAIKPYFTPEFLSDWKMTKIVNGARIEPWELIKLRDSGNRLPSIAPRISFFTTPAFLAKWNTNDSNAHRVTVNQALLVALGQGFTNASQSIPVPPNTAAVDGAHAVDSSECYACHKSLDPMKQFFENSYFNNDKPSGRNGAGPQPSFGFENVTANGRTLKEFGQFIAQVVDERVSGDPISRFALEMTQKLCYFANSTRCVEDDPEFRRVAREFEAGGFKFKDLVVDLYSSPLVTMAASTKTFEEDGIELSIVRRDQLCQGLSSRLNIPDVCQLSMNLIMNNSKAGRLAGALPYDSFSRGVAEPVTAASPNIFYRGGSELLCEYVAELVVDGNKQVFSSGNVDSAIEEMVSTVMGMPTSDPKHVGVVNLLKDHYNTAKASSSSTDALRSTFSAACQSPTSTAMGI